MVISLVCYLESQISSKWSNSRLQLASIFSTKQKNTNAHKYGVF